MEHPRMVVAKSFIVFSYGSRIVSFNTAGHRRDVLMDMDKPTVKVDLEASGTILAISISPNEKNLVIANDYKQVIVFDTDEWKIQRHWTTPKKAMKIMFEKEGGTFLVADKFGDVSRFSMISGDREGFGDSSSSPDIILGHLSMILDFNLLAEEKLIATCDRDGKIRISHYPNTYNIESFCLGHMCCVTKVVFLPLYNVLVSGAADGTVCFWNYSTGSLLSSYNCSTDFGREEAIVTGLLWCENSSSLVVVCSDCNLLLSYNVSKDGDNPSFLVSLTSKIQLESAPWVVQLLEDHLWVITPSSSENHLTVFNVVDGKLTSVNGNASKTECEPAQTWKKCVGSISASLQEQHWDIGFYQDIARNAVDGSVSYYKRKQERLEGKLASNS